jgi:surface polysaccharide O-acyltransferase-like enzyme
MEDGSFVHFVRYYLTTILSTCVPLFFFANGYLLFNKSFNLKKHIKKTIKIVLLTCVWGIITILSLMPIKGEYLSLQEFVACLFTLRQGWTNHLWYMCNLALMYVFFPLLKMAYDKNRKIFNCFVIVCAILTFGNRLFDCVYSMLTDLIGIGKGITNSGWFDIFNFFSKMNCFSFVYFCVGGIAHKYIGKIRAMACKRNNIILVIMILISCLGLFATGMVLSNINGEIWDVVWNGYDTIFTFINVCAIFALSLSYKGENKTIETVSKSTLGIYFIHKIFISLTVKYINIAPLFQTFTGCVVYAAAIEFVCLALVWILNKVPLLNRLVKL